MLISLIRTLILYILIVFSMRFMGKRQIGQLQPSELAITILVSNMATFPIENINMPIVFGVFPILCLISFEFIISVLCMKSIKIRNLISGKPVLIVENGKINQQAMRSLRFTTDDLIENLRDCEIFDLNTVAYAIVETNGKINVLKKLEHQTVTPQMLNINSSKDAVIQLSLITNGKILEHNLKKLNLTTSWLKNTLIKKNLKLQQIFLMTADKNKNIFIAIKESKK